MVCSRLADAEALKPKGRKDAACFKIGRSIPSVTLFFSSANSFREFFSAEKDHLKRETQDLGSRARISFSSMPKLSVAEDSGAGWEAEKMSCSGQPCSRHGAARARRLQRWALCTMMGAACCRIRPHSPCLARNSFPN